jgi:hypothetical protein
LTLGQLPSSVEKLVLKNLNKDTPDKRRRIVEKVKTFKDVATRWARQRKARDRDRRSFRPGTGQGRTRNPV